MTRTSPGTVDRNDLHALPSPHFTNDSDLDCIDMYMPSPNTLLATPNFAYPSIPTRSDALPINLNHMAVIPQHDWTTQLEPTSTQTGNIDPVDRWVSRIATESSHIYPALQVAHTDGGTARAADASYKVSKKPEELVSHHEFLCLPWAVLFSMMKGYVSILITRHFLSRASGEQRSRLWNR